jgi:hypothetical protein
VGGARELAEFSPNKFTRLCELYGVGVGQRACGQRVVELSQEFISDLRVQPAVEEREPGQEG